MRRKKRNEKGKAVNKTHAQHKTNSLNVSILVLTIIALIIGAFGGGVAFFTIGGYLGIIASLIAWYLALAGILPYVNPGIKLPVS